MAPTARPGTAADVVAELAAHADPERATHNARFFKTGPGEYGEGDVFLGCGLSDVRRAARTHRALPLDEVDRLLDDPVHEHRLAGVILLAQRALRATGPDRDELLGRYLAALERGAVNNWDLVDASAAQVLGALGDEQLWAGLARSGTLWQRRAAAIATFAPLRRRDAGPSLRIARILVHDDHDLIHKAVGWVLRDVGARVDRQLLCDFLDAWAPEMPRTMLRYAIEKFPEDLRQHYLRLPRRPRDRPLPLPRTRGGGKTA